MKEKIFIRGNGHEKGNVKGYVHKRVLYGCFYSCWGSDTLTSPSWY